VIVKNKFHSYGFFITSFLILALAAFKIYTAEIFPQKIIASDLTIQNILDGVNKERELRNILTLNQNHKLSLAAQSKADDMMARKYFSHTDPEGHYIWDKIVAEGYTPYLTLGENLAIEFYDTESLINAWMNSPTHRANLLNENFKDQGMGLSFGQESQKQYHSAIANTFGALLIKKVAAQNNLAAVNNLNPKATKKPQAKKTAQTATKNQTVPKEQNSAPLNVENSKKPVSIRGEETFALNTQPSQSPVDESKKPNLENEKINNSLETKSSAPVFGSEENTGNKKYRLFILILGGVLSLLLISDVKYRLEEKTGHADKKLNNLLLLVLSLIVVGFMYWV
jgi:uncharacterized protein YkwD